MNSGAEHVILHDRLSVPDSQTSQAHRSQNIDVHSVRYPSDTLFVVNRHLALLKDEATEISLPSQFTGMPLSARIKILKQIYR